MKSLLVEAFTRFAMLRAVLLAMMGAVTWLFPEFLLDGMVYVLTGYAMLNGVLGISDYFQYKSKRPKVMNEFKLTVNGLFIAFSTISVVYYRYLVSILPVFLGGFMMVESIVYFVIAVSHNTKARLFLTFLAVLIMIGGIAAAIFTFGFGGIRTLSQIFGTLLLLSCAYEWLIYIVHRRSRC